MVCGIQIDVSSFFDKKKGEFVWTNEVDTNLIPDSRRISLAVDCKAPSPDQKKNYYFLQIVENKGLNVLLCYMGQNMSLFWYTFFPISSAKDKLVNGTKLRIG